MSSISSPIVLLITPRAVWQHLARPSSFLPTHADASHSYANSVLQTLYFCAPFRDLVIQHSVSYPNTNANTISQPPATRRRQDPRSTQDSSHPARPPPRSLFAALRALYVHISQNTADKGTIAPRPFIEKLRELNEGFRNTMHHDAHEFLNYLLNRIVEEMEEEKRLRLASGDDRASGNPHHPLVVFTSSPVPRSTSSSSSVSQPPAMTASASTSSTHSPGATFIHQIFEGVLTSETRCLTCENVRLTYTVTHPVLPSRPRSPRAMNHSLIYQ